MIDPGSIVAAVLCHGSARVYPAAAAKEKRRDQGMEHEVEIVAAGRKVELNPFTESIVANTIAGLLGSLKGVDLGREVSIALKPKARS